MGGYLRQHQIEEIQNERDVIERTLKHSVVQDRGNLEAHMRRIDHEISTHSPPDLTPEERDQKARECREIEERLVPLMPSDTQMRRNPPGVVGQHKRFDKASKKTDFFPEGDIFRWKNNQLALNKGDDDPDVANFERLRPLDNHGSMLGAQIPGKMFFGTNPSPAYLEGHDRTFGTNGEEVTSVETSAVVAEVIEESPKQPRRAARRKKSRSRRSPNKNPVKMTALACGKKMGPHGRHFHVAKCVTCQEAAKE